MALFPVLSGRANFDSSDNAATDTFSAGIRYTQAGAVRTTPDAGTVFNQGIPMSPSGQVAVLDATAGLPADVTWLSGMPISGNKVCVSTNAVSAVSSGTPYDAAGAVAGSGYFIPRMLFLSGAEGVWYDPSDSATLFSDTAGTTPCAAPGAGALVNVGLMLDKSKGLVLGSELVTNGDFNGGTTGWTLAGTGSAFNVTGGVATVTTGTTTTSIARNITTVAGTAYQFTITRLGGTASAANTRPRINGVTQSAPLLSNNTTQTMYFFASGTSTSIGVTFSGSVGETTEISNISVRELPGNHAISYNATTARPELSARVNLLTYSEEPENAAWTKSNSYVQQNLLTWSQDFDNAAWTKSNATVIANAAVAPDGTITADKLIPTLSATDARASQALTGTAGITYTLSVYAKAAEFNQTRVYADDGSSNIASVFYNLTTGTITSGPSTGGTWTGAATTSTDVGSGWWRITLTWTATGSAPTRYQVRCTSTGDGTSGIFIWGAQLVQGSTAGDYTQTTSAAAPTRYTNWDGTLTGRKLVETTANSTHYVSSPVATITAGAPLTASVYAKLDLGRNIEVRLTSNNGTFTYSLIVVSLVNGSTVTTAGNATSKVNTVTPVGNGWYRISVSAVLASDVTLAAVWCGLWDGTNATYTGDGTSGIFVGGADLRPANIGANVPVYQRIADQYTYDTVGFPRYLRFDGVDDGMSTPANLNLSATDKATVFAGVRKLSDAAVGVLTELSNDNNTNNGTFAAYIQTNGRYTFISKGTVASAAQSASFSAPVPITNVISGLGDISGDSAILRVNGAQAASSTSDQGTGNYGTYPLYIGARNNASLWFNGYIYSVIVVGAASTAAQISSTEQWIAGKEGITL